MVHVLLNLLLRIADSALLWAHAPEHHETHQQHLELQVIGATLNPLRWVMPSAHVVYAFCTCQMFVARVLYLTLGAHVTACVAVRLSCTLLGETPAHVGLQTH